MSASHIVATLQGHELVLNQELNEINADITVLQQMSHRYTVQCGIPSIDIAYQHLCRLRSEKERLLAQVTSQLRSMQDHVASSTALVNQLSFGPGASATAAFPSPIPVSYPMQQPLMSVSHGASAVILPSGGQGLVQVHTPSGLVVTTNSAILANSPGRQRM